MIIWSANFVTSSALLSACPNYKEPEFAFIGRSNVGKSSFINMLTNKKNLAKVSGTPGKTRLINHFIINDHWYLVDLPGYGFARISKPEREKLEKLIYSYFKRRRNLRHTYVLIDSRLDPQANDVAFMTWLALHQIHFTVLFTKSDKVNKTKLAKNIQKFENIFSEFDSYVSGLIPTSIILKKGKAEVLKSIEQQLHRNHSDDPPDTPDENPVEMK
jgi:GTP-binding protein